MLICGNLYLSVYVCRMKIRKLVEHETFMLSFIRAQCVCTILRVNEHRLVTIKTNHTLLGKGVLFTNQEGGGIWIWDMLNFSSVFAITAKRMHDTHSYL